MKILVTMPQGFFHENFFYPETIERIKSFGDEVVFNETTEQFTHEEICEKIKGVDIAIIGWGTPRFDEEIIANADKLKYIAHTAGSIAPYVCEEAFKRGIRVLSGNELFAESVAEGVMAYILASSRSLLFFSHELSANGNWINRSICEDIGSCFYRGIMNKTVGIVSYGTISKYLLPMLKPFHIKIKIYSRKPLPQELLDEYDAEQVSLEELFATSDIVTIQTARNPHTIGMINKSHLSLMKDNSIFVNTSRGEIVNEEDLLEEVKKDRLFFVLDVFHKEPLPKDSALIGNKRVMLIPHMGGPTFDRYDVITNTLLTNIEEHMATGKEMSLEIPWELAKNMTQ